MTDKEKLNKIKDIVEFSDFDVVSLKAAISDLL